MGKGKYSRLWLFAFLVIGFALYYRGIAISYYQDDFYFFSGLGCSDVLGHFLGAGRAHSFYRPIEAALLACVQEYFGLSTIPIHIVTISLHAGLSWLVFVVILELGFPASHAVIGSLFMLFSQANASAVLGNDTLSQVTATFFGCLSLWFLSISISNDWVTGRAEHRLSLPNFLVSILAFTIALFSKETGVSFFPMLFVVLCASVYRYRTNAEQTSIRKTLLLFLPYVLVLTGYFVMRRLIGALLPTSGSGVYNFNLGTNVLNNVAQLFVASTIPISTVTAYTSIKAGQWDAFALIALASILFMVLIGYGLWHYGLRPILIVLGILLMGSFFPVAMLNHVSELYTYNSLPFIAMIVGICLGTGFARARTGLRTAMLGIVCLLFTSHIVAVVGKTSLMKENGDRATSLLMQLQPYAARVPTGGELVLVNPKENQPEYSVFLMSGFHVLAESRIKKISNRDDITVKIVDQANLEQLPSHSTVLTLSGHDDEVVEQYPR